jgi:hypothetical protein
VRAETCSDVTCVIYTRKEVVAKEAVITVFIGLCFLDPSTSWRRFVSFAPQPLYPRGKSFRYPLDRRLGLPQSRSGRYVEAKILDPTGTRTPSSRS